MMAAEPLFGIFPVPDAERADRVVEQVLLADRLGLDLAGIQDHPYQRRHLDAWTLLAYLAGRTERIRLFPDVANLPLRPPALLAKAAASLDRLSGGRVELGLGAGAFWEAIAAWNGPERTPKESVDALEEAIAIIRRVWAGERGIRVEGAHYRLAGAHGGPPPAHDMGDLARRLRAADAAAGRPRGGRLGAEPAERLPLADVPARHGARSTRRRSAPAATRRASCGWRTSTARSRTARSPAGCTGRWSTGCEELGGLVRRARVHRRRAVVRPRGRARPDRAVRARGGAARCARRSGGA